MNYFFLYYHLIVFFIFQIIYFLSMNILTKCWDGIDNDNKNIFYTIIDSFYFTVCTHTSLGFGDITPKSRTIRLFTSIHMISVFVSFVFL